MAHRRSRRLQGAKSGPASGEELLCLFLELNGLDLLDGQDRGSLALAAVKFLDVVAQQVTGLDLTVSGIATAQQQLEWQHRRQQGVAASSSSASSRRQKQQRGAAGLPNLLQHLVSRMPQLGQLKLFYNTVAQPSALGAQLKLIAQVPQLTALSLRDAASCAMPSSGLAHISVLTGLKQLNLLVQSTGQRPAFTQAYAQWKANIMRALTSVTALTRLQHLQLRFICGERGYFYSQALLSVAEPLTQLTHLDLGYVDVPPGGLDRLAGLSQLRHCILYGRLNKIVAQDFTGLSSLQSLQRLEMFHDCPSHLDDPGAGEALVELGADEISAVSQVFAGLSQLSWLNLPLVAATKPLLPLLHKLPGLEQLYLQSISREQATLHLAKNTLGPGVRVLQVDNVKLDTDRLDKIASLTQLRQLTLFNLQLLDLGSVHALSKLSKLNLEQFCFDALVADTPEHIALFDNRVLRSLGPAWPHLHSLHISYTALPPTADLVLDAFREMPALRHLSLYASPDAALDQHTSGKPLVLDCSSLPAGLESLYLCSVTLEQPERLPPSLLHLWLSDAKAVALPPGSSTLLDVVTGLLPNLQTLVLRLAWPPDDQVLRAPISRTADLELIASRLSQLTCLGLSLPVGVGPQLVDLRALAPLTNMRQLLLDYCCDQPAPANGAAAAAGQPQPQQQPAANGVPPLPPPPPAQAAAGGGGAAVPAGGGVGPPVPLGPLPFAFVPQNQAGGPGLQAFGAALQAGGLPMLAPQAPQQQQQQPQPPAAAAAGGGIGAEMALMHIGGGVAEAVRQIGWALRVLGAADLASVQGVEAAINACIAARGQLMGGHGVGPGIAGLQQARAATQALMQQAQGQPIGPVPGADVAAGTVLPVLATAVQALQTAGLLLQQGQQQQQGQAGAGNQQAAAAAAVAGAGGGNAVPPLPAAAAGGGVQGLAAAVAAAAAAAPQAAAAAAAGPAHPAVPAAAVAAPVAPAAAAAAAAGGGGGGFDSDGEDQDEDQDLGDDGWVDVGGAGGGGGPPMDLQVNWGNPNAGMGLFGPGLGLKLDSEAVVQQLAELCVDLRRLQGVWLSDNVLGHYPAMPLQQLLAAGAPRVVVRAAVSDWFWGTNFPIGSSLEGDNPLMWWMFTPWSIL